MFVVSNGIPKSGSTLLMYYTELLLRTEYSSNGQDFLQKWIKQGVVSGVENYINDEWVDYINFLIETSYSVGPFVLKTHILHEKFYKQFNKNIVVNYTIRDPRDIILSIIDHGNRTENRNKNPFKNFSNFESALQLVENYCKDALDWYSESHVNIFRYEELINTPIIEITRLGNILNVKKPEELAKKVISQEISVRVEGKNQFNKGLKTRFLNEMTTKEIEKANDLLCKYILLLGYSL